jgi:acyl-[acyl-carrier-protein]-phospholipid O-acyltransferase / long-chain-fatty-acid--[acyl-carrier-protein] ligase
MKNKSTSSFWSLIVTQFCGAFNDNVYKILVSLLVVSWVSDPRQSNQLVAIGTGIFAAPFLLFSMISGRVADRVSKSRITVITKIWELAVVVMGIASLWQRSIPLMMISLFMLSLQATFFSPAKYGILPEIVPESKLSSANAWLNIATFAAILVGTIAGGMVVKDWRWAAAVMVAASIVGLLSSLMIHRVPAVQPNTPLHLNPFSDLAANWRVIKKDRPLKLSIIAVNFFWFMGAALQTNIFLYAKEMMGVSQQASTYLIIAIGVGIGVGSYLAGRLSGGKVELGLVPIGALGMTIFCADLLFASHSLHRVYVDFFMLGAFAGLYDIPLVTLIQWRSPAEERGKILATSNFLSFVAIGIASLVLWGLGTGFGLNPAQVYFALGLISLIGSATIIAYLPDALLRLVFYVITNTIYKIKVIGRENVPATGPALLVANHLSLADGFLVGGAVSRLIRFLIWRPYYEDRRVNWLLRTLKAIPVSEKDSPKEIMRSLLVARKALEEGHMVCIFAEGEVSRTGNLLEFKRGFEVIVKGLDVTVIPVLLDRVWGSIFSFEHGKVLWKKPRRIPYPVTVTFGTPIKPPIDNNQVRQHVLDMSTEAFAERLGERKTLPIEFLRRAKKNPEQLAMADSLGKKLKFGDAAAVSVVLARQLELLLPSPRDPDHMEARPSSLNAREGWREKAGMREGGEPGHPSSSPSPLKGEGIYENVGIMVPPSCGAALLNIAVSLLGRVPVNLNYTTGEQGLKYCIQKAGITRIITTRRLLEKVGIAPTPEMIYIEDIMKVLSKKRIIWERVLFTWLPAAIAVRRASLKSKTDLQSTATILFSSGSTGVPKGVVLSHANILSNCIGLGQVYDLGKKDRVLGILPFFHSFGFTGTLWFPLIHGFGAVYHANPLDAKVVGELTHKYKATLLVATPTFLSAYIRKCTKEQFASLRYVITGAERLRETIAEAFQEKFGKTPMEGYGCTELSPVVTANVPDVSMGEISQVGHKPGKIGHPIPGVSVKIVNPDTFAPVPQGQTGLLLVKGPNVMKGYWQEPDKTNEVMRDGWYITGDIASIDNDGFVQITDRLNRFSKIGGEMVPHVLIEEKLHQLAGRSEPTFVVTAVPDAARGEQLVVLHAGYDGSIDELWAKLNQDTLPKLWIPAKDHFFAISSIPYLGTGKLDLSQVKQLALAKVR